MKKTIIAIIILVAIISLYFWAKWEVGREIYLEKAGEDIKTLERESENLRIDNRSMKRELEILRGSGKG